MRTARKQIIAGKRSNTSLDERVANLTRRIKAHEAKQGRRQTATTEAGRQKPTVPSVTTPKSKGGVAETRESRQVDPPSAREKLSVLTRNPQVAYARMSNGCRMIASRVRAHDVRCEMLSKSRRILRDSAFWERI